MNLTLDGEQSSSTGSLSDVQFISFNQDYSTIAIGLRSGYSLFSIENDIDQLQRTYQDESYVDICVVERLFSSSLVVIVSLLSPRKLRLYHIKKKTEISIHSYTNTILSVKLNRQRLVICLEEQLYIHSLKDDLDVKWVIRNIPPNPKGLFALSPCEERCYLAYPASQKTGEIQIFDALELKNKILIPAHDNPLVALAFNQTGTMLASASEKGTVIRVHQIDDGQCLYEFRRGYARCVDIYSLSFSLDSLFLAASSSTETVHIFKLEQARNEEQESSSSKSSSNQPQPSWGTYLGRALVQSSTYISSHVSDILNQWRSFATCRLPFKQMKNVCAITVINGQPRVLVVSSEGYLYIYNLDVNEGGDCILIKQHRLFDDAEGESSCQPSKRDNCSNYLNRTSNQVSQQQYPSSIKQPQDSTSSQHHYQHQSFDRASSGTSGYNTDNYSPKKLSNETPHQYDNEFPPLDHQIPPMGSPNRRRQLD